MRNLTVKLAITGSAYGMFPIGQVTEMLYQVIDYLEERDKDGADLEGMLPFNRSFREGMDAEIHLAVT